MQKLEEKRLSHEVAADSTAKVPVSVIIPVRNEAANLPRCLEALREMGCPLGQGFLYAPAVSSHTAEALLAGGVSRPASGSFIDRREDLSLR